MMIAWAAGLTTLLSAHGFVVGFDQRLQLQRGDEFLRVSVASTGRAEGEVGADTLCKRCQNLEKSMI